jgi:hypothetical protein
MSWIKLVDCKDKGFWSGVIFKFPVNSPLEKEVLLMLYEPSFTSAHSDLSLIKLTGHSASIGPFRELPRESLTDGKRPVSANWLIEHWHEYVIADTDIDQIYIKLDTTIEEIVF